MNEEKVDINQAEIEEFAALPRIGEKLAEKIVKYRKDHQPFSNVTELADVPGVSDKMVSELEDRLIVQESNAVSDVDFDVSENVNKKVEKTAAIKKSSPPEKKSDDSEMQLLALRTAARSGDIKKVKALIEDGADGSDKYALIWAAQDGHSEVVTELIKGGADVNSKTAVGGTNALTLAAQNGHLKVVKSLINAGADVNEPTIEGWTPLMKATFFNHETVVQALLEAGAEIHARNLQGLTAIDLAEEVDNRKIFRLLNP